MSSKSRHTISHRGLWADPSQASSAAALTRGLEEGFGIETDLRDFAVEVVVSYDPAEVGAPRFISLLESWRSLGVLGGAPIALNVKADGLAPLLDAFKLVLGASAHFFFEMSFPQLRAYAQSGPCGGISGQ